MAIALPLLWPRHGQAVSKKFPNQDLMAVLTYSSMAQCHLQGCDNHAGKGSQNQIFTSKT